ncbi:cytochrome c oxidase subunit 3 [Rhodoferax sp. GW822-FHT02A01]|uniref:cytochrome c oxidase subunit 3 n=1 Tax=Rhodoferax sp. GW822-FHT02A01 TaxID=3141537 RepID=UPI00315CB955
MNSITLSARTAGSSSRGARTALPGDLAVWIFIFAELLVFAVLFLAYALARRSHIDLFNSEQALLDRQGGLINTLVLISSSYAVACAGAAIRANRVRACMLWLCGAWALGAVFLTLKAMEFSHDAAIGMQLSRNLFDMFYLSLTFFHFMHVLMAMVIVSVVIHNTWLGRYSAASHVGVETASSYWHMVDLVWIILFVLVYVLH